MPMGILLVIFLYTQLLEMVQKQLLFFDDHKKLDCHLPLKEIHWINNKFKFTLKSQIVVKKIKITKVIVRKAILCKISQMKQII